MGRYRFAEDVAVADCAVDIQGQDVDDVFATAAEALAVLMVDPGTVAVVTERRIELDADALDLLLFDWLSELIFLKDRDRLVFTRIAARVTGAGPFHLEADVAGGLLDRERASLGADPKAVTLYQFRLEPSGAGWRARVVIDI